MTDTVTLEKPVWVVGLCEDGNISLDFVDMDDMAYGLILDKETARKIAMAILGIDGNRTQH